MRKLLATVVAGAIAAATLATVASADFTYTADKTTPNYSYSITQTYTFAKQDKVSKITIGLSDPATMRDASKGYVLSEIKVNGQKANYEAGKATELWDGLQNTGWSFIGKDMSGFVVEYVYTNPANEKKDIQADMNYWVPANNVSLVLNDNYAKPEPLNDAQTEFASNEGQASAATASTITFNFKLAEKAALAAGNVTATVKLAFGATTADVEMIKVEVGAADGSTQTIQTAVMKGATSAELVIPAEYLYNADYGNTIRYISVGAITGEGLKSNSVVFAETTPADADDDADEDDVDADDVDDADDTDADLDDTDDTDDVDADDTDADNTDADADNTGDADGADSADGDKNVPTGVALAVVPAAVAAAAAIVAKKRK